MEETSWSAVRRQYETNRSPDGVFSIPDCSSPAHQIAVVIQFFRFLQWALDDQTSSISGAELIHELIITQNQLKTSDIDMSVF